MTLDVTLSIRLLILMSIAGSTLSLPPKSVLEKRLMEAMLDGGERRHPDHGSFVGKDGKDGARKFEQMGADDAGIGEIYDRIDLDYDGRATEDEMMTWIRKVHMEKVEMDAESLWSIYIGESGADRLTWETFRNASYGSNTNFEDIDETDKDLVALRKSLKRSTRLWPQADQDGDGELNKRESRDFFFPEESDTLKEIVVDETMEELDGNNDGYISQEEYLKNLQRLSNKDAATNADWFEKERKLFVDVKDLDKDNRLSRDEVKEWLVPAEHVKFKAEAQRLIRQADTNQDGVLSKKEMTEDYYKFEDSKANSAGKHQEF